MTYPINKQNNLHLYLNYHMFSGLSIFVKLNYPKKPLLVFAYYFEIYDAYLYDGTARCLNMCRVLRKLGIMHVRKVSSQISLCSPHRLIRDDTFRLNWIFAKKRHHLNEKFHKSGNCHP